MEADRNRLFRRLVSTRLVGSVSLKKKIGDKLGKGLQWTETANRLGIKFCEYGRYSILIVEKCCSNVFKSIALVSSAFFFSHRVDWLVWSLNIA